MTNYTALPIVTDKETYYVIVSDEQEVKAGDCLMQQGSNQPYKIIAQSKQVLEGIPMFDKPDDKELKDLLNLFGNNQSKGLLSVGYNEAKQTYKWTDEDMQEAFLQGYIERSKEYSNVNSNDFLSEYSQPKSYKVELEYFRIYENGKYIGDSNELKIVNNKLIIKTWEEIK